MSQGLKNVIIAKRESCCFLLEYAGAELRARIAHQSENLCKRRKPKDIPDWKCLSK